VVTLEEKMAQHPIALPVGRRGLTTANILYHLPDHPAILQSYLWQEFDLAPDFPRLRKFLDFWTHELDGLLHSVTVSYAGRVRVDRLKVADVEFSLH